MNDNSCDYLDTHAQREGQGSYDEKDGHQGQ